MGKILALILILMTGTASAQSNFAELRTFDATPEFIFKHKNVSIDCVEDDFFKLKFDKEILSLMGTGLEWNVALNAVDEKVLPSVGANLYMRIRPRLDIYTQFSGLTIGRRGHVTDFESGLRYFPQKNFSISAGWREINFKRKSTFNLRGLFAGVRYDF